MVTYDQLRAAVMATGLWNDGRGQGNHRFALSASVFTLSAQQVGRLTELGRAVDACLLGVSRLMAIGADSNLCGNNEGYRQLRRSLGRGAAYGVADALKPGALPLLRKVDIVPGADDNLWIAEIDATNPRSWGYSLVGRELCKVAAPGEPMLPGVVPFIAAHLAKRKVQELVFLHGNTQRFYAPEFAIVADAMAAHGVTMYVADEDDVVIDGGEATLKATGQKLPRCFVDFPFMNHNKPLIDWLAAGARNRTVDFLVPPKHYLSSKVLLALLSNPDGDERVEHLLRSQIEPSDLAVLRRHLPETRLVDSKLPAGREGTVLKKAVSSGMKGVVFSDAPGFDTALAQAQKEPGTYVLQRQVEPAAFPFATLEPQAALQTNSWFVRLTAYMSYRGVEDVAVTARTDKRVHGATDAILTGTVIAR